MLQGSWGQQAAAGGTARSGRPRAPTAAPLWERWQQQRRALSARRCAAPEGGASFEASARSGSPSAAGIGQPAPRQPAPQWRSSRQVQRQSEERQRRWEQEEQQQWEALTAARRPPGRVGARGGAAAAGRAPPWLGRPEQQRAAVGARPGPHPGAGTAGADAPSGLAVEIGACSSLSQLLEWLEANVDAISSGSSSSTTTTTSSSSSNIGDDQQRAGASSAGSDGGGLGGDGGDSPPPLLTAALAAITELSRRRGQPLLPGERARLRALLQQSLLPALHGHERAGGPEGAAAALGACACAALRAGDLPRRQLAALMAAAGEPAALPPRALGTLLPALAETGHDPGPAWLSAAAAALHFRRADANRHDVVASLAALAALRHAPPAAAVADLLAGLTAGRQHVSRLRGDELVALLAALRALGYRPSRQWLRVFADATVAKLPLMAPGELAALLRGLSWAGAAPPPPWAREFLRRSWAVLPGAGPAALAELLHFALLLRLQPPVRWVDACLARLQEGQRSAVSLRKRLRARQQPQAGQDQEPQQQQAGQPPDPQQEEAEQRPRAGTADGEAELGLPPLLTPHQIALAAHALALLPLPSRIAARHVRWLRGAVVCLQPDTLGLPLRELSYLLYAVGRLRMDVPQPWLRSCLAQLHALLQERQQAQTGTRGRALQQAPARTARQQPQQQQTRQQQQQQQQQPDAAELAAALSLMAHFASAAEPEWVRCVLAAVAAARAQLTDEALGHVLISCAALRIDAATPPARDAAGAEAASTPAAPPAEQPAAATATAAAAAASPAEATGQLLALSLGRLRAQAASRDAVALSRSVRLLQAHRQRGQPAWYEALLEQASRALAACAEGRGSAPERRLGRRAGGGTV
ncbi:hypothetical protein Rsub_08595 [Raphidocelis subcapitata]|uniref:Uncharacterized protein n=1 Tax=Raphidocelis subcapitata TaxID=307507 RepID=A0A2V0PCI5_9CHLO|nr:hypothetical protein Rsub_08595 [Raphidocelis subcapitata]|eukprot:GBF95613.1 hypothetical protein Rsub_08595 [Raphidocelis subcapitata]